MTAKRHSPPLRSRLGKTGLPSRGFTLIEVMTGLLVSTMALLALIGTAFIAYEINHKARLRDNARAVLRTFTDQFQRISPSENVDMGDGTFRNTVREFFKITPAGTQSGSGLVWGSLSTSANTNDEAIPDDSPLEINIGPPGSVQFAYVTRQIRYVNPATGAESDTVIRGGSGFMLKGTFTITYSLSSSRNKREIKQSMSALRLVDY